MAKKKRNDLKLKRRRERERRRRGGGLGAARSRGDEGVAERSPVVHMTNYTITLKAK